MAPSNTATAICQQRHRFLKRRLALGLFLSMFCWNASWASNIAVLEFGLHDLTLNPNIEEETKRTATLRGLVAEELAQTHKHIVPDNPPSAAVQAAKGQGYLFDRPKVAAEIGLEAGADWVVSGRLHKASFLFVYLRAQLINTKTGTIAADFVVEIKGGQKKLTSKGTETLALQIHEALATLEGK